MSELTRVMIDIETVGLEPGSAILSIGAVAFDADGLGDEFHVRVNMESCQQAGLEIDANTLQWWLEQDNSKEVLSGGRDLPRALSEFRDWMLRANEVWANSPKFDCCRLETAFEAVEMDVPWTFRDLRDYRTLSSLPLAPELEHEGTEHDALDDAKYQARVASETLARIEDVWATYD